MSSRLAGRIRPRSGLESKGHPQRPAPRPSLLKPRWHDARSAALRARNHPQRRARGSARGQRRGAVDLALGLPGFFLVGLPDAACIEAKVRCGTALRNSGFALPQKRATMNSRPRSCGRRGPRSICRSRSGCSRPGASPARRARRRDGRGRVTLAGEVLPIRGALPIALLARQSGRQAAGAAGQRARGRAGSGRAGDRRDFAARCGAGGRGGSRPAELSRRAAAAVARSNLRRARPAELQAGAGDRGGGRAQPALHRAARLGQDHARAQARGDPAAALVRRSGRGHFDLVDRGEAACAGAPHRAANARAAPLHLGGRSGRRRGAAAAGRDLLAHQGALLLDELPEFSRSALEALRQPLEDGLLTVVRAKGAVTLPARCMVVATMNPCPCGRANDPDPGRCRCGVMVRSRYRARISGPILDRFDLHIEAPALKPADLTGPLDGDSSETVRARVIAAREVQAARFSRLRAGESELRCNAQLHGKLLRESCDATDEARAMVAQAIQGLGLSARAHDRILKVARTIADFAGDSRVEKRHVGEAIQLRALDRWMIPSPPNFRLRARRASPTRSSTPRHPAPGPLPARENQTQSLRGELQMSKLSDKLKAVVAAIGAIEKQFGKGPMMSSARSDRRRYRGRAHRVARARHRARHRRTAARPGGRNLRSGIVGQDHLCAQGIAEARSSGGRRRLYRRRARARRRLRRRSSGSRSRNCSSRSPTPASRRWRSPRRWCAPARSISW